MLPQTPPQPCLLPGILPTNIICIVKDSNSHWQTVQANPVTLPEPLPFPKSKTKNDEFFGNTEVYYKKFAVEIPLAGIKAGDYTLTADYQGCAEAGLCYPPMRKTQTVQIASAGDTDSLKQTLQGLKSDDTPAFLGFDVEDEPLDPEVAFKFASNPLDNGQVEFSWAIADGYYLYRDKLKFELQGEGRLGEPTLPKGKIETDEFFGSTEVYYQQLNATMPVYDAGDEATIKVTYQGCAKDRLCYPPQIQTVTLPLLGKAAPQAATTSAPATTQQATQAAAPISEQDNIAQVITQGSVWLIILTFFGFGLFALVHALRIPNDSHFVEHHCGSG